MRNQQEPLVSAYIPTHNRAGLLERAINSVLKQTWQNIELIVVDDASEDDTPILLAGLKKDTPVTVIRNKKAKGAAACRNIAIEHATGNFVAGLDDDDYWHSKRIELLMASFKNGFSAVCSNDKMDFGNKEIVWKKKPVITLNDLLFYNRAGNQVLTKKEYILQVGGYDETLPSAQDYDLWIRLAHNFGPIKTVQHALQVVNMSDERERITTSAKQIEGYIACFEKHQSKMNEQQRKYQKYRIKQAAGERVSWIDLIRSVPAHLLAKEITRKVFL